MVSPSTRQFGAFTDDRNSRLFAGTIVLNISFRLPAMVISLTGKAQFTILDPESGSTAAVIAGYKLMLEPMSSVT